MVCGNCGISSCISPSWLFSDHFPITLQSTLIGIASSQLSFVTCTILWGNQTHHITQFFISCQSEQRCKYYSMSDIPTHTPLAHKCKM